MAKERIVIELNGQDDIDMRDELKRKCGYQLKSMGSIIKALIREYLGGDSTII